MPKKNYVVVLKVKADENPKGWDWLTLMDATPGEVKVLKVREGSRVPGADLLDAGERVLMALNDDHESCGFCGCEEGQPHEDDAPCGQMQRAVRESKRR